MISGNRPRNTHIFERAANDLYIEPSWVSERLFAVETFSGVIRRVHSDVVDEIRVHFWPRD